MIVHAWKEVRAHNEEDAKEFARQVQVHAERNGNVIRIYKEHPKPPNGINVAIRYEIQSPSAVSVNFRTSNGKIQLNRVDSTVDAQTRNGRVRSNFPIRVNEVSKHSLVGQIGAGRAATVKLQTPNGSIHLKRQ